MKIFHIFRQQAYLAAIVLVVFLQACQPVPATAAKPSQAAARLPVPSPATVSFVSQVPSQSPGATHTSPPAFTATATSTAIYLPVVTQTAYPRVVFAAIGDYGSGSQHEADVASQVISWQPDFIITLGDNNYPDGAADFIDEAIGQFYHAYIYPYHGSYGAGAYVNRFFPTLGNHDVKTENGKPYYDYFTLPGNERYYDFVWGPLHMFAVNMLDNEPDGVGVSSKQAAWLKKGLADSASPWNIVYTHYPPYSSGTHGSTDWARWPYKEWGADVVLAGHDHTYERLLENGMTYFVNGLGGSSRYDFGDILPGSQVRYNADFGATRVIATADKISFEFILHTGEVIDSFELTK